MTNNQSTLFDMVKVWIIADRENARTCNYRRIERITMGIRDVLSLQGVGVTIDETRIVVENLQTFYEKFQ